MQGWDSSVEHLQACIPTLKCTHLIQNGDWMKGVLCKHGPQHDMDLDEEDLLYEVQATRNRREDTREEGYDFSDSGMDEW